MCAPSCKVQPCASTMHPAVWLTSCVHAHTWPTSNKRRDHFAVHGGVSTTKRKDREIVMHTHWIDQLKTVACGCEWEEEEWIQPDTFLTKTSALKHWVVFAIQICVFGVRIWWWVFYLHRRRFCDDDCIKAGMVGCEEQEGDSFILYTIDSHSVSYTFLLGWVAQNNCSGQK